MEVGSRGVAIKGNATRSTEQGGTRQRSTSSSLNVNEVNDTSVMEALAAIISREGGFLQSESLLDALALRQRDPTALQLDPSASKPAVIFETEEDKSHYKNYTVQGQLTGFKPLQSTSEGSVDSTAEEPIKPVRARSAGARSFKSSSSAKELLALVSSEERILFPATTPSSERTGLVEEENAPIPDDHQDHDNGAIELMQMDVPEGCQQLSVMLHVKGEAELKLRLHNVLGALKHQLAVVTQVTVIPVDNEDNSATVASATSDAESLQGPCILRIRIAVKAQHVRSWHTFGRSLAARCIQAFARRKTAMDLKHSTEKAVLHQLGPMIDEYAAVSLCVRGKVLSSGGLQGLIKIFMPVSLKMAEKLNKRRSLTGKYQEISPESLIAHAIVDSLPWVGLAGCKVSSDIIWSIRNSDRTRRKYLHRKAVCQVLQGAVRCKLAFERQCLSRASAVILQGTMRRAIAHNHWPERRRILLVYRAIENSAALIQAFSRRKLVFGRWNFVMLNGWSTPEGKALTRLMKQEHRRCRGYAHEGSNAPAVVVTDEGTVRFESNGTSAGGNERNDRPTRPDGVGVPLFSQEYRVGTAKHLGSNHKSQGQVQFGDVDKDNNLSDFSDDDSDNGLENGQSNDFDPSILKGHHRSLKELPYYRWRLRLMQDRIHGLTTKRNLLAIEVRKTAAAARSSNARTVGSSLSVLRQLQQDQQQLESVLQRSCEEENAIQGLIKQLEMTIGQKGRYSLDDVSRADQRHKNHKEFKVVGVSRNNAEAQEVEISNGSAEFIVETSSIHASVEGMSEQTRKPPASNSQLNNMHSRTLGNETIGKETVISSAADHVSASGNHGVPHIPELRMTGLNNGIVRDQPRRKVVSAGKFGGDAILSLSLAGLEALKNERRQQQLLISLDSQIHGLVTDRRFKPRDRGALANTIQGAITTARSRLGVFDVPILPNPNAARSPSSVSPPSLHPKADEFRPVPPSSKRNSAISIEQTKQDDLAPVYPGSIQEPERLASAPNPSGGPRKGRRAVLDAERAERQNQPLHSLSTDGTVEMSEPLHSRPSTHRGIDSKARFFTPLAARHPSRRMPRRLSGDARRQSLKASNPSLPPLEKHNSGQPQGPKQSAVPKKSNVRGVSGGEKLHESPPAMPSTSVWAKPPPKKLGKAGRLGTLRDGSSARPSYQRHHGGSSGITVSFQKPTHPKHKVMTSTNSKQEDITSMPFPPSNGQTWNESGHSMHPSADPASVLPGNVSPRNALFGSQNDTRVRLLTGQDSQHAIENNATSSYVPQRPSSAVRQQVASMVENVAAAISG